VAWCRQVSNFWYLSVGFASVLYITVLLVVRVSKFLAFEDCRCSCWCWFEDVRQRLLCLFLLV